METSAVIISGANEDAIEPKSAFCGEVNAIIDQIASSPIEPTAIVTAAQQAASTLYQNTFRIV